MKTNVIRTVILSLIMACVFFVAPVDTVFANSTSSSEEDNTGEPATVEADGLGGIGVKIDPESGNVVVDGLDDKKGSAAAWNTIFIKYKGIISGIAGVLTLTMIVLFLFNLSKVAGSSGNPTARTAALSGLLWTGIATAGIGAVDIVLAIFYNALK